MTCLESENKQLKEDTGVLSDIIIGMQKSLNKIDSEERSRNLIVSGFRKMLYLQRAVTFWTRNAIGPSYEI